MEAVLIYITCADRDEARRIGRQLVQKRLAACTNVFSGVESFFQWEGRLEQADETVLIAKTVNAKVPDLIEAVRALHSYTVPAVLVMPVTGGNSAFMDWVASEVGVCDR
jgi:periplasmic divalent cation tolerance protein